MSFYCGVVGTKGDAGVVLRFFPRLGVVGVVGSMAFTAIILVPSLAPFSRSIPR